MTDASSQRMRDAGAHPPRTCDDGARETARDAAPVSLTLEGTREVPVIRLAEPVAPAAAAEAILARAEALTAQDMQVLRIVVAADPATSGRLLDLGAARALGDGDGVEILPGLLWQCAARWLPRARPPFPELFTATAGRRHPLRPRTPAGTVYARAIPWLDRRLSFRTMTEPGDVALFSTWMNDPRIASIWQETGTLEAHAAYIAGLQADPATLPLLGCLDGRPFGYFELYWARESRLGPLYEAGPYDRGWHVAIGDASVRGRPALSAWLPSLMHYLFLDEPRTQRVVGEPRADHAQQIRNLHGSGFATIATVDFPHKRAALVALSREHFVRDRLWVPGAAAADAVPRPPAVPA
ncbi:MULTISPECIES: GNAT family N-acetyltransferase [Methylobacterium]|uniref:GNAT family N-acetyltransferase n=1 Tax=Methylobacterium TaxID=407 RepID=UPI00089EA18A|nr:GNAT family N-acetyltransferase [Methylobacterium sp. 190mf]SEG55830.1 Protein N-acetyltransferase, RimJ/RimL family [Methylobacterium sp. 190mf]